MAEVPEHLLQRAAARRAQLTGGGGGDAPSTTPAVAGGESAPATTAPAAAAAPAKVTPTEPAFIDPVDRVAAQRVAEVRRRRVPAWAMGVLAMLPLWGIFYIGAFGEREHHEEVVDGSTIYGNNCASCHGASGGGGAGPKLSGGEVTLTFPNVEDHTAWIRTGSAPVKGQPYGNPNRPGGPRIASGGMPGFEGKLTDEEIQMVVEYERDGL